MHMITNKGQSNHTWIFKNPSGSPGLAEVLVPSQATDIRGLKDARLRGLAHILNASQVAQRPQLVDTGIPSEAIRFRMTT